MPGRIDEVAARVRRLPPSWSGPTAAACVEALARVARLLDDAGDAAGRAGAAARRVREAEGPGEGS